MATPSASTHFEAVARREKVAALVRHVCELCGFLGLSAETDGYLIADLIRGWGDQEWAQACVNVGKPKASVETRLAVIQHFTDQARKAS